MVIEHDLVLQQRAALEHRKAVAGFFQKIIVRSKRISLFGIERLIFAGLTVQHRHILDAAISGHADEFAPIVDLYSRIHIEVDGKAHTGNMLEAAGFTGQLGNGHLQSIQNRAAGYLRDTHHVAERMNGNNLSVGDIARGDRLADAAAVDERNLRARNTAVRIGTQIAEVRLLVADDTHILVRGILRNQVHIAVRHDLVDQLGKLGVDAVHNLADAAVVAQRADQLGVSNGRFVDQHRMKRAVLVNRQNADIRELRTGRGQKHVIAVLVLHGFARNNGMRMRV